MYKGVSNLASGQKYPLPIFIYGFFMKINVFNSTVFLIISRPLCNKDCVK